MPARPSTSRKIRIKTTTTCKRRWSSFSRTIRLSPVNRREGRKNNFALRQLDPSAETVGGSHSTRRSNGLTFLGYLSRYSIPHPTARRGSLHPLHIDWNDYCSQIRLPRRSRLVFLQGIDENGRDRIVGFSEQQLSTFAFEVRMK